MKLLKDQSIENKIVLVRVDFNVPLAPSEDGKIQEVTSDFRINAALPTLEYLQAEGAKKIVLISHLGRPDGAPKKEFSLEPVAKVLKEAFPDVFFLPETTGEKVAAAIKGINKGCPIFLLENLRFDPREEGNDRAFAEEIVAATGAELFVQDGFAVVHRAHASTAQLPQLLPSCAGLLLEKEIKNLTAVRENPTQPLAVIIGGAKVADKQPLIDAFAAKADQILIGGKIAADGYQPNDAKNLYVAEDFDETSAGDKLDIGPVATYKMIDLLAPAKTVIWNGCLGKVEDPAYDAGTTAIAEYLGLHPEKTVIILGGDTVGFVENLQADHPELTYTLLSTGGGAALEFLLGQSLPGLDALN